MSQNDARDDALTLPETVAGEHMGTTDLRVRKRIFLTPPADRSALNLKIEPANLASLVARDPARFRDVRGGRWVGIRPDRPEWTRGLA